MMAFVANGPAKKNLRPRLGVVDEAGGEPLDELSLQLPQSVHCPLADLGCA